MTTFDERERAFEAKFSADQDLMFRIYARRAKLVGRWAAEQMGMGDEEAKAYSLELVTVDLEEPGHADVLRRILNDFAARGLSIPAQQVEQEMAVLLDEARRQLLD
ncbi:DUF1476 domain-containing protein [Oleisolibacter albus]|uniref:DUF1476 domain-containing protein n=1 Tax=Oleisolibacter albus TaxID=2171757 RepID=UPI000DF3E210|nr:DUF1476 domain-containing protein [Oleisolibacter albus]